MRLFAFVAACWFAAAAVAADPRDPATARAGGRDTATAGVTDSMAQRMQACVVCHGKEGRATRDGYYPRIAGKPADYLYNQLVNFQNGRRTNRAMSHLLQHLTDDYLREIARYFASLDLPYPPAQPDAMPLADARRAEQLVREGMPDRKLPACVQCHGQAMAGRLPAMPGLLTLPRDYLLGQFGAWREGSRRAAGPDCMAEIARRLTPDEIALVSTWLSSRTLPTGARAEPAATAPLPMDCGSARAGASSDASAGTPPGVRAAVPVSDRAVAATADAARIERGRYLALAGNCAGCHVAPDGTPYAGGRGIETPFGTVFSSNLTPHPERGIGRWTAGEFWRAMHDGRSRDGRLLYPAFPYPNFSLLTRDDAEALFAWLRTVPPSDRPNAAHALRFPYGTQAALAVWRVLYFAPARFEADPARSEGWNRGRYLVEGLGHCAACHSPRNTLGGVAVEFGGGPMPNASWYAPSLSRADEAGVAAWPREQIVGLLKHGVSAQGTVSGPMAEVVLRSTQHLSDVDLSAIAEFLSALPQRGAPPEPVRAAWPALLEQGREIYREHCAGCHGLQGQGVAGIYPPLAGNRAVTLASPINLIQTIRQGGFAPATAGNPRPFGMPPYYHVLNDEAVAAVASHVRQSWGNQAGVVTQFEVSKVR